MDQGENVPHGEDVSLGMENGWGGGGPKMVPQGGDGAKEKVGLWTIPWGGDGARGKVGFRGDD